MVGARRATIPESEAFRTRHEVPRVKKETILAVMHMSSACPWGRTPGQPGEYVGEYKGMN